MTMTPEITNLRLCWNCKKPLRGDARKRYCNNICRAEYHREMNNCNHTTSVHVLFVKALTTPDKLTEEEKSTRIHIRSTVGEIGEVMRGLRRDGWWRKLLSFLKTKP